MAVFTPITFSEATSWIETNYSLGQVTALDGIESGIENSNFFLTTQNNNEKHEFVLTIFERLTAGQLPYYLELMLFLAKNEIAVPAPMMTLSGGVFAELKGKPAAVISKLSGKPAMQPQSTHCEQVGLMLAKLHLTGKNFTLHQENLRSLSWWQKTIPTILPHVSEEQRQLLLSELSAQELFFNSSLYQKLPEGPSHCDLFRDNVLFIDSSTPLLSGFFDFYFAGKDKWLFDLAVTVNDWCIDQNTGKFLPPLLQSTLESYKRIRTFTPEEQEAWPMMLRSAALRFWVSRLWDFYLPREAKLLAPHDPNHFEIILKDRIKSYAY
ncbi:MAG: homoserine kinase [Betaproteobacteria bacterium]|jgi:homoserine kinase type II